MVFNIKAFEPWWVQFSCIYISCSVGYSWAQTGSAQLGPSSVMAFDRLLIELKPRWRDFQKPSLTGS